MQLKRSPDHPEGDVATDDTARPRRVAALRERLGVPRSPAAGSGDIDLRKTGDHRRTDDDADRVAGRRRDVPPVPVSPVDTGDRPVVTEDDIRVMTRGQDLGVYRARRRFGGFDAGATLAGVLAATGMTAVLGALVGAVGTVGYQLDVQRDSQTLSLGGFVAGLVVLVLSFAVGGWVAGRSARYDGGVNGAVTAVLFVALSAVAAGFGTWLGQEYDVFSGIRLPQWFSGGADTAAAVASAFVALVVMVAAGWVGGMIGSRYHRRVDNYLAEYAQGNRPVTAETLIEDSHPRRGFLHR